MMVSSNWEFVMWPYQSQDLRQVTEVHIYTACWSMNIRCCWLNSFIDPGDLWPVWGTFYWQNFCSASNSKWTKYNLSSVMGLLQSVVQGMTAQLPWLVQNCVMIPTLYCGLEREGNLIKLELCLTKSLSRMVPSSMHWQYGCDVWEAGRRAGNWLLESLMLKM